MRYMFLFLLVPFIRGADFRAELTIGKMDTIYVKLPHRFDTARIRFINPYITSFVVDSMHLPSFKVKGELSFDFGRNADFKFHVKKMPARIKLRTLDIAKISDSLTHSPRLFLPRHTFFIIITQNDTAYFYKAKGTYMYKDYKNDVSY